MCGYYKGPFDYRYPKNAWNINSKTIVGYSLKIISLICIQNFESKINFKIWLTEIYQPEHMTK